MLTSSEVRLEALRLASSYNDTRSKIKGWYKDPIEVMRIAAWYTNYINSGTIPEEKNRDKSDKLDLQYE